MERFSQDFIDLLPVGVWVSDSQGQLIRLNKAARRIWGIGDLLRMDQLGQYRAWDLDCGCEIGVEDWPLVRAVRVLETTERKLIRLERRDGTYRTVLISAVPLYNQAGAASGAVAINEDVTELELARERGRESERLLRTVFDLLPVGVWVFDREGKIALANPAAGRIWGGSEWRDFPSVTEFNAWWAPSGERIAFDDWASWHALREGRTSLDQLINIRAFDGVDRTVLNSAAPLVSDDGTITGAVAVNQDVTPLYRAQQRLQAAVRDREKLLAVVAHDLRSPLSSFLLSASLITHEAGQLPGGGRIRERAEALEAQVRTMAGLVNDLLAVAVGSEVSILDIERVSPAVLIDDVLATVLLLFKKKGVGLVWSVPEGLPEVGVDRQRIGRVWANLLDNALKHTEPGGEVTIMAKKQVGVVFAVSNSGPALTLEEREAMFCPFWQARHDTRGAGLGLSISRAIVEAHGGIIWAEPAEGQRVCVKFELPRAQLGAK